MLGGPEALLQAQRRSLLGSGGLIRVRAARPVVHALLPEEAAPGCHQVRVLLGNVPGLLPEDVQHVRVFRGARGLLPPARCPGDLEEEADTHLLIAPSTSAAPRECSTFKLD